MRTKNGAPEAGAMVSRTIGYRAQRCALIVACILCTLIAAAPFSHSIPTEPGASELARTADSVTYHVSTSGDDASTGTSPAAAWRTLEHAVDNTAPGDTILVLPGTYVGARIEGSGAAGATSTRTMAAAYRCIKSTGPSARTITRSFTTLSWSPKTADGPSTSRGTAAPITHA